MNATVAQLAERHASNVDVAGSLPVGRSISEHVVAILLENDADDFLERQGGEVSADLIKDNLEADGFQFELHKDEVDGIELYPMTNEDGGGFYRLDSLEGATHYGVSLHKRGGGLYSAGDFTMPDRAYQVARMLKTWFPNAHWIDEIDLSESDDIDAREYVETTFSPVCKAVDVQRDLHEAGFTNIRVFRGGKPPEYAYVEAWMCGTFFNVRKEFRRVLKRHGLWNMQLPPDPNVRSGKWNKEGWVDDRQSNLKHINRRCHIYVPPWAIDVEGHSPG